MFNMFRPRKGNLESMEFSTVGDQITIDNIAKTTTT